MIQSVTSSTISNPFASLKLALSDTFNTGANFKGGPSGNWSVASNSLSFTPVSKSNKYQNHVTLKTKPGNKFAASVDVKMSDFSSLEVKSAGFILRKQDKDNFLAVELNTKNEAKFVRYEKGVKTVLKAVKLKNDTEKNFNMKVEANVNRFDFYIDNRKVLSANDSTFKEGELAFGAFEDTTSFENFKLYS
jgi:fructan beta-fructosidase